MRINHITAEMNYKLALLEIFESIKTTGTSSEEHRQKRAAFLERLSEKFEYIPSNTMEENQEFFSALYDAIVEELSDYYSIETENRVDDEDFRRRYFLTKNDKIKEMEEIIEKYCRSDKFMNGYLRYKDNNLLRIINASRSSLANISGLAEHYHHSNGAKIVSPFYIPNDKIVFTPVYRKSYSIGNFFSIVEEHKRMISILEDKYQELLDHVASYKEEVKEKMIQEYIRFGATYLKEIFSRIIIPVSCLEDETLKEVCEKQGREVFVRKPEVSDFLFPGSRVHIFSSHDLEDDSSYVIKPVTVEPTIPTDTEELKYHGVGLYSNYDDTSARSLGGTAPHVIGGVLYCKADLDEFYKIIPEELLEEIRICEKLVESIDEEVGFENDMEGLAPIIQKLKQDDNIDVSDIVQKFLDLENLSKPSPLTEEQKRDLSNKQFKKAYYSFNQDLLITTNSKYPYGFCIFKDASGNYAAIKRDSEGNIKHLAILERDYGNASFIAACKVLDLPSGLYPIYSFAHRTDSRETALIGMEHYTTSE